MPRSLAVAVTVVMAGVAAAGCSVEVGTTPSGPGPGASRTATVATPATPTMLPAPTLGADAVTVAGDAVGREFECSGSGDYNITATNSHVTFNGICGAINVIGSGNEITLLQAKALFVAGSTNKVKVDTVDRITLSGLENRVTYRSGTPEITNAGIRNTAEKG